ncbi:fimbria/pilus chaperone family protein [Stenotrophomonas sp. C3(2023)]|uniref:fimbria/pilus chaperone family protein n=1 Tax=Stenotrophomonas sp. C3(2023) TaxID=3080277 RepID=UPI00293C8FFC|nr:fimbria/pilus chaperone family protein [Stenotrophomonas sp. C3(2023)]MDV3467389.1 fimbria/pilus chaperone family protein [Stenotrophomonas sp. C3(2023)]
MKACSLSWRAMQRAIVVTVLSVAAVLPVSATSFMLESNTIVLKQADGRVAFTVTNPGDEPMLLLSRLDDLDDAALADEVLVTPAVTRIDPGQSQVVLFQLKDSAVLEREHMLRASFEGVVQQGGSGMRMPVRQQIGFIVQPRGVPVELAPWKDLLLEVQGNELVLHNRGRHVVRMGPDLELDTGAEVEPLDHPYLMPGQTVRRALKAEGPVRQARIVPLSRSGFALQRVSLPVTP